MWMSTFNATKWQCAVLHEKIYMLANNKIMYSQPSTVLTAGGVPLGCADRQFDTLAWSAYFRSRVYTSLHPKTSVLLKLATRPETVLVRVDSSLGPN